MCALKEIGSYSHAPKKLDLDLTNQPSQTAKTSIVEPPMLESKELPNYLRYTFLGYGNTLPESVADDLSEQHVEALISALMRYKRAMGRKIDDIIGISPEVQEVSKRRLVSNFDLEVLYVEGGLGLGKTRPRTRQGLYYGLRSRNLVCHSIGAAHAQVQWHQKTRQATTSQRGQKRGRKEQGESSVLQIPRRTLGNQWGSYEELLRMTTLMMIPMNGV
ncbi:hypothetical protein CQW23_25339 [Capsicum baccatum]|uniref:Uncharacterized protein n=1 Tax=Capsicum baccatum TaxID=33114 RepID=A0A2G2VKQ3_CAPBA|nr:hypothetical protein CQW23_25339 [Capsicum baccatum]